MTEQKSEHQPQRVTRDGRPLLVAITLGPRGNIGFSVPASNDDIVRQAPYDLLKQLRLLAQRLENSEYPFSFLKEPAP